MRLSKVAKELNVGIANIVDHLASKGVKIDGRPNTKITPDSYEILRQEFSADVEQHKRSAEIAQARRNEKEAQKEAAAKKALDKQVIKAKAAFVGPKTIGKIDINPKEKAPVKEEKVSEKKALIKIDEKAEVKTETKVSTPKIEGNTSTTKPEEKVKTDSKPTPPKVKIAPKKDETKVIPKKGKVFEKPHASQKDTPKPKNVIKAKGSLSGPKQIGKIDVNKPIKVANVKEIKVEKFNKPEVEKSVITPAKSAEIEILIAKS